MKLFPNLAGSLRFYFGIARVLVVIFTAIWIFILLFLPRLEGMFGNEPKLLVSVGEVAVKSSAQPIQLQADAAKAGAVALTNVRGSFQADLFSKDHLLASAVRWATIPRVVVNVTFAWLLLTALRQLCANIERREVISENNLRLVKKSGWLVIAFTVSSFVVELWTAHAMSSYLAQHITLTAVALAAGSSTGHGALNFVFPAGFVSTEAALVIGCMLLLLAEAFRQGLAFKAENDLTV
jgi:hypothetical protein